MTGISRLKGRGTGGNTEADPVALIRAEKIINAGGGEKGKERHRISFQAWNMSAFLKKLAHENKLRAHLFAELCTKLTNSARSERYANCTHR